MYSKWFLGLLISCHTHHNELMFGRSYCCPQKQSFYTLTIKATDMGGAPAGKTGTGKQLIKILDINDNTPSLDKDAV